MTTISKAIKILKIIEKQNYQAYIVGGFVRDFILNIPSNDIDICTNCPINILEKLFNCHNIGQSKDFGIVAINFENEIFEIAQFRTDINSKTRKPESIAIVSSFKKDVSRRDFTINALGMCSKMNIIDFVNGQMDIKNKIVTTVGNSHERFMEDHLRILRAIRFAVKLEFDLDAETKLAIKTLAHTLNKISKERIFSEILKICKCGKEKFAKFFELSFELGVLEVILPKIALQNNFKQNPLYHPEGTVFQHTIAAIKASETDDVNTLFAILFHDYGKVFCAEPKQDFFTFYKHESFISELQECCKNNLKMTNEMLEIISFCTENHMRIIKFKEMKKSKIVSLIQHKHFNILFEVFKADNRSRCVNSFFKQKIENEIKIITNIIETVNIQVPSTKFEIIRKTVNGNLVMNLTNCKPGVIIGNVINETIDCIIENDYDINDTNTINNLILTIFNKQEIK